MAMEIKPNAAYTLKEIEQELGVLKIYTLRDWIKKGKLRATKMGRSYLVLGEDLLAVIRNGQTGRE